MRARSVLFLEGVPFSGPLKSFSSASVQVFYNNSFSYSRNTFDAFKLHNHQEKNKCNDS